MDHRCPSFIFSSRYAIWRGQKTWFFYFSLGDSLDMFPLALVNEFLISLSCVCVSGRFSPPAGHSKVSVTCTPSLWPLTGDSQGWVWSTGSAAEASVNAVSEATQEFPAKAWMRSSPSSWNTLLFLLPLEWQKNRKLLYLSSTVFDIVQSLLFFFFKKEPFQRYCFFNFIARLKANFRNSPN